MNEYQQILKLIDLLIEMEIVRDEDHKRQMIAAHKASAAIGESSMLFHLRALKVLAENLSPKPDPFPESFSFKDGQTYTTSVGNEGQFNVQLEKYPELVNFKIAI